MTPQGIVGAIISSILLFVALPISLYIDYVRPLLEFAKPCKEDIDTLLENKDPSAEIFYFDNGFFDPIEVPKAEYYAIMLETYLPNPYEYTVK